MLQVSESSSTSPYRSLLDRVTAALADLSCTTVRARSSGPHVLLWADLRERVSCDPHDRGGKEPFARVTPLGGASYGLAFRAIEASLSHTNAWEPLLLVDDLPGVIEHALIAIDAVPGE